MAILTQELELLGPGGGTGMLGLGRKSPIVMCPGCDQPMTAVAQKHILFTNGLVDVTYVCETCHTNATRTIKPDNSTEPG